MGRIAGSELIVILGMVTISGVLLIVPAARISKRIGFSPWLGLLAAVPIANLALLWTVAFMPWPRHR